MRRKRRTLPISEHWQLVKHIWRHPMVTSGKANDGTKIHFFRCRSCGSVVTEHPSVVERHKGSGHVLDQPVTLSFWDRVKLSVGMIPYVPN